MVRYLLHFARDARGTSSERWAIIAAVAVVVDREVGYLLSEIEGALKAGGRSRELVEQAALALLADAALVVRYGTQWGVR